MKNERKTPSFIIRPTFYQQVLVTWQNFEKLEGLIRNLIINNVEEYKVLSLVKEALLPVLEDVTFTVKYDSIKKKHILYLSPDGVPPMALPLFHFASQIPNQLKEKWEVIVGLPPSEPDKDGCFNIEGIKINLDDIQFSIVHDDELRGSYFIAYIGNLLENLNYGQKWLFISRVVQAALGEARFIRFVGALELVDDEILEQNRFTWSEVKQYLLLKAGGEDAWKEASSLDYLQTNFRSVARKAGQVQSGDIVRREEVTEFMTCMPMFDIMYIEREPELIHLFFAKGIVPGFLVVDMIDEEKMEQTMRQLFGSIPKGIYLPIGYGDKESRHYFDIIVYDIDMLFSVITEKASAINNIKSIYFKTFDYKIEPICLVQNNKNKEDENE